MILKFIHPDAKAGREVNIPGFHEAPIGYGEEVEFPDELATSALATGHWEEVAKPPKPAKKESD